MDAGARARREGRPVRIVHHLHAWNDRTIAAVVGVLATEASRRGFDVSVIAATQAPDPPAVPAGVEVVRLTGSATRTLRSTPMLARTLRRIRPDVVFSHGNGPIRSAILATRGWSDGPVIVGFEHNHYSTFAWNLKPVRDAVNRLLLPRADLIAGVSPGIVQDLAAVFPALEGRLRMVPPPLTRWDRIAELSAADVTHPWLADGIPTVVAVGHVHPRKDHATLVRAFARLRDLQAPHAVRLMIIGGCSGDYARQVKTLAMQLGVADDVAFLGAHANPLPYLARASVFALSSRNEGMPVTLLEALACGTPAVSTDCPSGPRWLFDGERYGLLSPVGDDERLAGQISRILEDDELRARLRIAGPQRAARFSPARVTAEQLALVGLEDPSGAET